VSHTRALQVVLAWEQGRTGFPWIDAIMTQLQQVILGRGIDSKRYMCICVFDGFWCWYCMMFTGVGVGRDTPSGAPQRRVLPDEV